MAPIALRDFTLVTCLGAGRDRTIEALRAETSGLSPCDFPGVEFPTHVGAVPGLDRPLEGDLAGFDCRNNRLAALTLREDSFIASVAAARERYGAARVGVFLGTSTSGLLQSEEAYRRRDAVTGRLPDDFDYARTHNTYSLARFVRAALHLAGPAFVMSSACAATAKTFASGARMIASGICDAAVVGGADTLCATTLYGFHSLGVIAEQPCRPFDAERGGISIGEAAGFVLLERAQGRVDADTVLLLGVGESSDAYHMSSPHPDGVGARLAMERSLACAGLSAADIDYINLHGTATLVGDAAEDRAVSDVFGPHTPCSSTKGFTGHTLGASGAIEAIFAALAISNGFMPGSPHTVAIDPAFGSHYLLASERNRVDRVISNSFGFAGANCSLVLGRA
ncbi:MAG TPA: beta-ketoacyl-[acyl-carrier-protein] synthase family protein [Stellaceae bacterium]|jgi:3-oxoacyl-[acyl-carrier-protein] synthase-1